MPQLPRPSQQPSDGATPRESPRHGFQGDRGAPPAPRSGPSALTIALSREAGGRGGSIARRVGRKLGWQVYDQELLEYMAQEAIVSQGVLDEPPQTPADWPEARLRQLLHDRALNEHPTIVNLARVILALGAQGQAVLIGRGAGYILPRETTLNVRIVAPLHERIAYMGQWLRLTVEEATERVRLRDERRIGFVTANFHRDPNDVHAYDVILNSSLLGEDVCAELIAQAARARTAQLTTPQN
jgi:cytidylate kinase